jgi:hypothetical protein
MALASHTVARIAVDVHVQSRYHMFKRHAQCEVTGNETSDVWLVMVVAGTIFYIHHHTVAALTTMMVCCDGLSLNQAFDLSVISFSARASHAGFVRLRARSGLASN